MVCTFFGHKDAPQELQGKLERVLTEYILNRNATMFYVGNQGNFDHMVKKALRSLKKQYTHIEYAVVLAYMPDGADNEKDNGDTIFPLGMENVLPKYAIDQRNRWMIAKADTVITYVSHRISHAGKWKEYAEKKGKTVINLA